MPADRRSSLKSLVSRTVRTFWALPSLLIAGTMLLTILSLYLDSAGLADTIYQWGRPFDIDPDTATDLVVSILAASSGILVLLFSIILIVLALATSSLGVRYIDRWTSTRTTRMSIGLYPSMIAMATLTLLSINSAENYVPRLSMIFLTVGFLVGLFWLVTAFHHLTRLIHVDASLAFISKDIARHASIQTRDPESQAKVDDFSNVFLSQTSGYVEAVNASELATFAVENNVKLFMKSSVGDFVLEGSPLVWSDTKAPASHNDKFDNALVENISIVPIRRDTEGLHFQIHLIVESAIRALSPSVNDQYTALDATHRLVNSFASGFKTHSNLPGTIADAEGKGAFHYVPLSVFSALDQALPIYRRTARDHPTVVLAFLNKMAEAITLADSKKAREFGLQHADLLALETLENVISKEDRLAVQKAKDRLLHASG